MTISRRTFLEQGGKGLALLIAVGPSACRSAGGGQSRTLTPNQWLRVAADGRVTLINDKSEMGQGASTVLPLLIADELGVALADISIEHAEPGKTFDDMGTSGSDTVASRWEPLRVAAAAAREMLVAAGAAQWEYQPPNATWWMDR